MEIEPVAEGVVVKIYKKLLAPESSQSVLYPMGASLFSPDGKQLLMRKEQKLQVVDVQTGAVVVTLQPSVRNSWSATYSPDGSRIAVVVESPQEPTHIVICAADTGKILQTLVTPPAQQPKVAPKRKGKEEEDDSWKRELGNNAWLSFSPDGNQLVAQNATRAVWVWDLHNQALRYHAAGSLKKDSSGIGMPLLVRESGEWVQVDAKGRLHLMRLSSTGKGTGPASVMLPLQDYMANLSKLLLLSFSPDGKQLLLAWEDQVLLADAQTGERLWEISVPRWRTAGYSADGQTLALAYGNNKLLLLQASTGKVLYAWDTVPTPRPVLLENIQRLSFSPDGTLLATCTENRFVDAKDNTDVTQLWETKTGRLVSTWSHNAPTFAWAGLSADGKKAMATLDDNTLRVWDVASGSSLFVQSGGASHFHRAAYTPEGARIVADGEDGAIRVWSVQDGVLVHTFSQSEGSLRLFHFSTDGAQLATLVDVSDDPYEPGKYRHISFWNMATGEKLPQSLQFPHLPSEEPRLLAAGSRYAWLFSGPSAVKKSQNVNSVQLLDTKGENPVVLQDPTLDTTFGFAASVLHFSVSPEGTQAAGVGNTKQLQLWDAKTGHVVHTISQTSCKQQEVEPAYSPDGTFLATVCDNAVVLRQSTDGAPKQILPFSEEVVSVTFLSPSHMMVSGETEVAVFAQKDSGWKQDWKKPLPTHKNGFPENRVSAAQDGSVLLLRGSRELQVVNGATGDVIQTISMPSS